MVTRYFFREQPANIWDTYFWWSPDICRYLRYIFEVVNRYLFRAQPATELHSLTGSPTPVRHFSRKKPMKIPNLGAGIPTTILETSQEQRSEELLPSLQNGSGNGSRNGNGSGSWNGNLQNGSCYLTNVVVSVDLPHRWSPLSKIVHLFYLRFETVTFDLRCHFTFPFFSF